MTEPILCTKADPWTPAKGEGARVIHEDAHETDEERDFGGGEYCVRMLCPHCGHEWWKELPQ